MSLRSSGLQASVMLRASGASSTLRLLDLITDGSGILDHPHPRVMTVGCVSAFSRHDSARALLSSFPSQKEGAGSAGCSDRTRGSHADKEMPRVRRSAGTPCAMVYGLYALSPESGLVSLRRPLTTISELDPSVGGSGLRDFARPRSRRSSGDTRRVHRSPHSTSGDDWPNAPLAEAGWRHPITIFRKPEAIFFCTET
jgi:hypothetical protein